MEEEHHLQQLLTLKDDCLPLNVLSVDPKVADKADPGLTNSVAMQACASVQIG